MTRFLLVRHAQTEWGSQHRYAGWSDVPVNATGNLQEERLIARLAHESFDATISSDLTRCAAFAHKIVDRRNTERGGVEAGGAGGVQIETDLREANFGNWEGRTYAEIEAAEPDALRAWIDDPLTNAPPGGETLLQLTARVGACLDRLAAAYPSGRVLVITHGGPIRCALCRWLDLPLKHHWRLRIDPASLTIVDTYPQGAIVSLMNDTLR